MLAGSWRLAQASGSHVGRFGGELIEQVGEVGPGIDRVPFGAGAEAHQDCGGPEPALARDEEPILSSDGQGRTARSALLLSMVKLASLR